MAVKTAKFGGTDWADGDILTAANLNDTFGNSFVYVGQATAAEIGNSVTETQLGEVVIAANKVNTRIIVLASVTHQAALGDSRGTFRIYTGTNAAFASNTERVENEIYFNKNSSDAVAKVGGMVMAMITAETWTGQVYVHLTGQNSVANASNISYLNWMIVIGV